MKAKSRKSQPVGERNSQDTVQSKRVPANRTHTYKQKRNRTKYHKSAPKKDRGKNSPSRRPIDRRFLIPDKQLRAEDVPAARALLLEGLRDHGSPSKACISAGVGRQTYYDWLHEPDGAFRKLAAHARQVWRASAIDDVEAAFAENAKYKDTLAGIFLLKHNRKRYREVSRIQLSGPDGGPIITLDAKEELIKRLEKMIERADNKPLLTVGGSEVREVSAGSSEAQGLKVVRSEGSAGSKVRKARGVRYG